jgi:hypothetical protein
MPKCLECGFTAPRLQWTHFKYKCTGRFSNGTEYREVYPNASLVDDELKKRACVTQAGLVEKYGHAEGNKRWAAYKQKQARSNTREYKKEKYGWTDKQFDEYNKSRAATLENMIARHGEIDGAIKWQNYCERQAYTNTLEYFVSKYGEEDGRRQYRRINMLKAHTLENVQRVHGCTKEEAKIILEGRNVSPLYTSELEKDLIAELEQRLRVKLDYSINTKQYCVWGNGKPNFYDIVHNNKAIEINGDYWHCNPNKYDEEYFHPHIRETAKDIWDKDKQKQLLLENTRNIPVLVIWESDYLHHKEEVIHQCVQWIQPEKK